MPPYPIYVESKNGTTSQIDVGNNWTVGQLQGALGLQQWDEISFEGKCLNDPNMELAEAGVGPETDIYIRSWSPPADVNRHSLGILAEQNNMPPGMTIAGAEAMYAQALPCPPFTVPGSATHRNNVMQVALGYIPGRQTTIPDIADAHRVLKDLVDRGHGNNTTAALSSLIKKNLKQSAEAERKHSGKRPRHRM